jgi:sulfite dehydrogenase
MTARRTFLKRAGALAGGASLASFARRIGATKPRNRAHVIVVGGGFGGATAAKYLRLWSAGRVAVTLVERDARFVSCPISNLVIAGARRIAEITIGYDILQKKWGVRVIHDEVIDIDVVRRRLRLAGGATLDYDRAILSPGVELVPEQIGGLAGNEERIPHAWKAGAQTLLLRRQLESMRDGGVYALHVPLAPYRCPPGPYERACVVADYFRRHKPRSKVLVLDANAEIQSKKALFEHAFAGPYRDLIEYRPNSTLISVDAARRRAELEFETVDAEVLNVVPPMRAGRLVDQLGVELVNGRWVDVAWRTMEAKGAPNVHVLGDAVFAAPAMPKSGHLANQHAKLAAAAILRLFADDAPNPEPLLMNTCYSFVDARNAMHIASVHRYDATQQTFLPVAGAGGLSDAASEAEGRFAFAWAQNIWSDMLA